MPSANLLERGAGPVVKRQKISNGGSHPQPQARSTSRIFAPFRTLGLVSPTKVPFTSVALGKTTFQITTSIGRSLQTYDLRKGLNLVFLTRPQTPEDITATCTWKDRVFAAWGGGKVGGGLWVFKRGKKVEELQIPGGYDEAIETLIIFGSWIIGCCSTKMNVWKSTTYEHYTTLYPTSKSGKGRRALTSCIAHLPTFLNKIFVGCEDGSLEIWNISTGRLVYTILPPQPKCGPITAMEPAPSLYLLAIAYKNGLLVVHDVRKDKAVMLFDSGPLRGPINSISFRSDGAGAGGDGERSGVMATSNESSGDITFWDLNEEGRVMGVLRGAHNPSAEGVSGGVNKVEFLSGQPVVITSGLDNSLKSWIFDDNSFTPIPRALHARSGHASTITTLEFLPSDADGADAGGKWLLSAGKDRSLWAWSLRRDGQSSELSQGSIRKKAKKFGALGSTETALEDLKAPEITSIAVSLNRDGGIGSAAGGGPVWSNSTDKGNAEKVGATGWESVVTGHRSDKSARTWFWGRKKAGRWAFSTGDGGTVESVAISPCGTFALIGSSLGGVDMFNLQSGRHRQRFPPRLTQTQAKRLRSQGPEEGGISNKPLKHGLGLGKHRMAVTGIMVDGLNRTVITCSLDGKIKFWNFLTGQLLDEIEWFPFTAITGAQYHRPNDLIAFACEDLSIRVIDIVTKKTVREFHGCEGGLNDFCFSNDGRWIIAASQDSIIRVWDLPTGNLVDAIHLESPCIALAFTSTGEFLATAHAEGVGVNIWNNRTLFTHVPMRQISESEITGITSSETTGLVEAAFQDPEKEKVEGSAPVMEQLSRDIETLSMIPKSQWQTLLHLDEIKKRNKPTEAPKAPEKAPFFLSALEAPKPSTEVIDVSAAERSRIMKMDRAESDLSLKLRDGTTTGDFSSFIAHMKSLLPAAADLEIRSLRTDELGFFVEALTSRLRQKQDYELVQTWMSVFLRMHADEIDVDSLREWRREQEQEAGRLSALSGYCAGVIGFLRSPRS